MTAAPARLANRWAIAASFGAQAVMMLVVASVGVTAATHPAVRSTSTTPQPALIAPQNPVVARPNGITLLPYYGPPAGLRAKTPHVAP